MITLELPFKGTVIITDLTGKTCKTVELSVGRNTLDVSDLEQGHYILDYYSEKLNRQIRFIKD